MKSKAGKAFTVSLYTIALYFVIYQSMGALLTANSNGRFSDTTSMIIAQLVTIPFIIYPLSHTEKFSGKRDSGRWEGFLWVAIVPILGIVLNVALARVPSLMDDEVYKASYRSLTSGGIWPVLILGGVIAPVLEELVFRGVVLGQFSDAFGPVIGIIVSSVLFGVIHLNIPQFIYGTVMGMVLGLCYFRMKKLWFPILAHSLANTIVTVLGFMAKA